MRNKKLEKHKKKRAQKAKRAAEQRKRPLTTRIVAIESKDETMRRDFIEVMEREHEKVEKDFWGRFSGWYRPVKDHMRGGEKLSRQRLSYFTLTAPLYLCDTVQDAFFKAYPRYKAFNYSVEVYPVRDRKLLHFTVDLNVLDTRPTPGGTIHMLPFVKFPANKPFGVTTHAVERMTSRVLDVGGNERPIGGVLRCPLVFVPYKNNIYGMYLCSKASPLYTYNGHTTPTFSLLGYLGVEEHKRHFIGVTDLAPGFSQTPEKNIPKEDMGNYKVLTVIDGVVHRALAKNVTGDINRKRRFKAVPYDLKHPNIHLLRSFEQFCIV